jgi:hypothetical protein
MAYGDTAQMTEDFATRQARKKAAADLAMQMGENAAKSATDFEAYKTKHLGDIEKAGIAGKQSIRAQAAEGLAAAQSAGGAGGGAAYGQSGDAGIKAGNAGAAYDLNLAGQKSAFETEMMDKAAAARLAGTGQQLEAQKFMADQGTLTEDRTTKTAQADAAIAGIIKNNKGFFNDDEATMYSQIMNLLATEDDPSVQEYIKMRANNIKNKIEDV